MVQFVAVFPVLQALHNTPFAPPIGSVEFQNQQLVHSEGVDDSLMEEEFNILDKIKCSGCCGTLSFFLCLGSCGQMPFRVQSRLRSGKLRSSFFRVLFQVVQLVAVPHS